MPKKSSSFTDDCASSWCCLPFFSLFKRKKQAPLLINGYAEPVKRPCKPAAHCYTKAEMALSTLSEPLLAGDIGSSTESEDNRLVNSRF